MAIFGTSSPGFRRLTKASAARRLLVLSLSCAPATFGCGTDCATEDRRCEPSEPEIDKIGSGESHVDNLLLSCNESDSCSSGAFPGLDCLCSSCTVNCDSLDFCRDYFADLANPTLLDNLECRRLPPLCDGAEDEPSEGSGVCDVACSETEDCEAYGSAFVCLGGYCRQYSEELAALRKEPECPDGTVGVRGSIDGTIDSFCIDPYEVTVEQYAACTEARTCAEPTAGNTFEAGTEQHPVDFVSPDDARTYCDYAGGSLPTKEQWQRVAQNGEIRNTYPWGETLDVSNTEPRVCALDRAQSCAVGSYPAGNNASAISDLAGNVAELVLDGNDVCAAGGSFAVTAADAADNGALQTTQCDAYVEPGATVGFRCVTAPLE